MIYELLTGKLPFDAGSAWEWATLHMTAAPKAIEAQPNGALLPESMRGAIMKALAKDKKGRYPSAGAFGQKLRSLRYSLETTSGDPATELAKIIDSTEAVERESRQLITPSKPSGPFDFDPSEATVIRIRTADEFVARVFA